MMKVEKQYELDKYWYLGFLALLGLPSFIDFMQGDNYHWSGFLWFLWLLNFLPNKKKKK